MLSSTTSSGAAREAIQQFLRDSDAQKTVPPHSSLFVWMVRDAHCATQVRNYTVVWDAHFRPGLNTAANAVTFQPAVLSALQRFAEIPVVPGSGTLQAALSKAAAGDDEYDAADP